MAQLRYYAILAALAAAAFPQSAFAIGLNDAAIEAGLDYFGSAGGYRNDAQYMAIFNNTHEFGQMTPGNTMKWAYTEPEQGEFDFSDADADAALAEANDQLFRCHTLVWYNQLADWVNDGSWTNETLIEAMQNHIIKEVSHFKGQCYAWDVPFNDDGGWRDNVFYEVIGPAYVPIAFAAAASADPDVKLYYNDYSLEYGGAKTELALEIVKSVQAAGAKIDGVGFQGHFEVGTLPSKSDLMGILESFTALDLEVAFTEVDIRIELPSTDADFTQQADDYQAVVEACVETEGCIGFTIWDFSDKYTWIPDTFPGYGDPLPWDKNFEKKPAYYAILRGLGVDAPVPTSSATPTPTPTPQI